MQPAHRRRIAGGYPQLARAMIHLYSAQLKVKQNHAAVGTLRLLLAPKIRAGYP